MSSEVIGRNPIDSPRTKPALIDCQASSSRSLSVPASSTVASSASMVMPLGDTSALVTLPTGDHGLCCHSSGSGNLNLAPSGTTMSPMRSVETVDAVPRIMRRPSSSTAFVSSVAYARCIVGCRFSIPLSTYLYSYYTPVKPAALLPQHKHLHALLRLRQHLLRRADSHTQSNDRINLVD